MSNTGYDTLPRTIEAMRSLTASQRFRYMNEISALPTFEDKKAYGTATPEEQAQRLLQALLAFDSQRNQGRNGAGQAPSGGAQVIPFPQPAQQPQPAMMGMPQQPQFQPPPQQPQQPQWQQAAPPQQPQFQQPWQPPQQPMGLPSPQSQVAPPGVSPTGMPASMPGMPPGMAPVQLPPPVPVGMPAPGMPGMPPMAGMPGMAPPQGAPPQMAPMQVAPPGPPPPMAPSNGMTQLPLPMAAPAQAPADSRDPEPPAKGKGRGKGKAAAAAAAEAANGQPGVPMEVLETILASSQQTMEAFGTHTVALGQVREAIEKQNALLMLNLAVAMDLYNVAGKQPLETIVQNAIALVQNGTVSQVEQMLAQVLGDQGKA